VQLACGADSCAVLVVPNVKVRLETQHSILHLSLHDLLWVTFAFRDTSEYQYKRRHIEEYLNF
jgi:hypothetical protein